MTRVYIKKKEKNIQPVEATVQVQKKSTYPAKPGTRPLGEDPATRSEPAPRRGEEHLRPATRIWGRKPKYDEDFADLEAGRLLDWIELREDRYWLKDFALERGYPPEKLQELCKNSEKFRLAYARARGYCEARLVKKALEGAFHHKFTAFVLKNVDGWSDEQKVSIGGQPGNPLRIQPVLPAPDERKLYLEQQLLLLEAAKQAGDAVAEDVADDEDNQP